jgi:hypothetical protein
MASPAGKGARAATVNIERFLESLNDPAPPAGLPALLLSLWHERRGDWTRAHEIAQDIADADAAWVHAYLHRREGDRANAAYWYRQARRPVESGDLDGEWRALVEALLEARQ